MLDNKILTLTLTAFILGVDSQASCTTSSPQCCWVVRSWQLMGKNTTVSSTSPTACCSMAGVTCDSSNNVIKLVWGSKGLSGSIPAGIGKLTSLTVLWLEGNQLSGAIPSTIGQLIGLQQLNLKLNQLSGSIPASIGNLINLELLYLSNNTLSGSIPASIGNLVNLQHLALSSNQLSGSIPASIGNLVNLARLFLRGNQLSGSIPASIGNLINLQGLFIESNPSLNGTFTLRFEMKVVASNTNVTLCGSASIGSPAFSFPPENTPAECLASNTTGIPLRKRAQVFSHMVDGNQYTCNNDTNGNPFQDCMNSLIFYCNSERLNGRLASVNECKQRVDEMTRGLNSHWQTWRSRCSKSAWTFSGSKILSNILNCDSAIQNLKLNAKYNVEDEIISVPDALIESAKELLWDRLL